MPGKKILKIASIIVFCLIIIMVLANAIGGRYLERKISTELRERVNKASHGEYSLTVGSVSVSFFRRSIDFRNLLFAPTGSRRTAKPHYLIKASRVTMRGILIASLLRDRELHASAMAFEDPVISIFQSGTRVVAGDSLQKGFSLYEVISPNLKEVVINEIVINKSGFHLFNQQADSSSLFAIREASVVLKDFSINRKCEETGSLFLAKKMNLSMKDLSCSLQKDLYTLQVKFLDASYLDSTITIDSVQVIPKFGEREFAKAAGRQASRVSLTAQHAALSGVDVKSFLERNFIVARQLEVTGLTMNIFRDLNQPLAPVNRPSLQKMIFDLPFFVSLDTIISKEGSARYEEIAEGSVEKSTIRMDHMSMIASGITNDSAAAGAGLNAKLVVGMKIFGAGQLRATLKFPYRSMAENFYCSGSIGAMPMMALNPLIENSRHFRITQGQVDSIKFDFAAGPKASHGKMMLAYHGLRLEKVNEKSAPTLSDKFKSFVLKEFLVKTENPERKTGLRIVPISATHNPYRYFIFYSMQSIMSGMLPSIVGEPVAKTLSKHQ